MSGAAFEVWLALETRIALENHPEILPWDRFSVENEHNKSDLRISDWKGGGEQCYALLEFKLVHNNKNWPAQVKGVRRDLYPAGRVKRQLRPVIPRASIVGFVGKMYPEKRRYSSPIEDRRRWESDALDALTSAGKHAARIVWEGSLITVHHEWLRKDEKNYFRLRAFTAA